MFNVHLVSKHESHFSSAQAGNVLHVNTAPRNHSSVISAELVTMPKKFPDMTGSTIDT